jgi:hypothetical protein
LNEVEYRGIKQVLQTVSVMVSFGMISKAYGPTRSAVPKSAAPATRGCQVRAQQQDEKSREMPEGIDFQYEATNEIPEPDVWEGEQWEVFRFTKCSSAMYSTYVAVF